MNIIKPQSGAALEPILADHLPPFVQLFLKEGLENPGAVDFDVHQQPFS
jgi:hypothetical protein